MTNVNDSLVRHQRENEWYFCSSIFSGSDQIAVAECGWLLPEKFVDKRLSKFWDKVLNGGCDGVRAANDTGLTNDLIQYALKTPNLTRVDEYARAVAEDVYLRDVLSSVGQVATQVGQRDIAGIASTLDSIQVNQSMNTLKGYSSKEVSDEFKQTIQTGASIVKTFIVDIDNRIGGFFGTELITLAARPGMGKTSLALQIGRNVAINGKKVLFFSLEMSRVQLWARMACPLAGYEWRNVRMGGLSAQQIADLNKASDKIQRKFGDNFVVLDDAHTVFSIHQACLHYRPDFVVIDQLPEIVWHDPSESRVIWYGKACKYLRYYIARKMEIPLLLVHQINRGVEERQDKRPLLADLRWSGEIEQRSDVVLFGYRDDVYYGRAPGQIVVPFELNAAKNRQGEQGGVMVLRYDLKQQWFK